jgi:hypothetical protein
MPLFFTNILRNKMKKNPTKTAKEIAPQILTINESTFRLSDFENDLTNKQWIKLKEIALPLIMMAADPSRQLDILNVSDEIQLQILSVLYVNIEYEYFSELAYNNALETFYNAKRNEIKFKEALIGSFLPSFVKSIMEDFQTFSQSMQVATK